jgi:hypothetical protein
MVHPTASSILFGALLARGAAGQLNLLVVGDWGGSSTAPYTTAVQLSVAAGMGAVGAANKISEVFGVGDNFASKTERENASPRPSALLTLNASLADPS